jgi:hypothetical protein
MLDALAVRRILDEADHLLDGAWRNIISSG